MSRLFIGTYTGETGSHGIYGIELNEGQEPSVYLAAETENPSFLTSDGRFLYAACELMDKSRVESYSITDGSLKFISRRDDPGSCCCHVSQSPDGKLLCASNFMSGTLYAYPIAKNGVLGESCFFTKHKGSGTDPVWQLSAHIHCSVHLPDGSGFWTCDMGADKMVYYEKIPGEALCMKTGIEIKFPAGEAPRHAVYSADGRFCYMAAELGNTVFVLAVHNENLRLLQSLPILPENFKDKSNAADIHLSKNGRFLYVSSRGWNGIAIYSVGDDGLLTRIGESSSFGNWPRNFAISPDGEFMAICNEYSGEVQICKLDENTGAISDPVYTIEIPSAVCAIWDKA